MGQPKLYYFNGRGVAEAIRLLFTYVKQPFEDIRFDFQKDEWNEQTKSKFFYGKLPVLEIDGKQLSQSAAILRHFGDKYGLYGKDEWEKAKVNEIIDFHKDVYNTLAQYTYVKSGFREGDLVIGRARAQLLCFIILFGAVLLKEKLRVEFLPNAENFFSLYVKLLNESGSGFLLPSGLSIADFVVVEYLDQMKISEPEVVSKFPELVKYIGRFYALPQLKEYVEKRTDPW